VLGDLKPCALPSILAKKLTFNKTLSFVLDELDALSRKTASQSDE